MWINEASEAQIITSSPPPSFVFKQGERLICTYCGSILDKNFKHTDEWIRSWRDSGVQHRSRMYRVWGSMRERCNNPKQCRYSSYGGRGIKVCAEWKDFAKFREWALSAGYSPDSLWIERITTKVITLRIVGLLRDTSNNRIDASRAATRLVNAMLDAFLLMTMYMPFGRAN